MSSVTAAKKMTKARANLVVGHPFFGALSLRLKLTEDPSIETAMCDGITIKYNPKFVDDLPLTKVQGLIAHEVMHPAFLHHTRRGSRDHKKWNIACDYAINNILVDAGFDLPEGGLVSSNYKGMTAEHIYSLLPENTPTSKRYSSDGSGNPDPGGDGGVEDSPEKGESRQHNEEAQWKIAVSQAAHVAKQRGKLPAELERLLENVFEPVLPWKAILHRFMTEKSLDDFSWKRSNRRLISQGIYIPSRLSEDAMGDVVVVIDTSGSITDKELQEFGSEITGIISETRPQKTYVMYCDARVAHVDEFDPDDNITFTARGGGGTDFRPPFDWLEEKGITPKALVYLTDGYGPFPESEPNFPTMWVINNHDITPPFGEHIILDV